MFYFGQLLVQIIIYTSYHKFEAEMAAFPTIYTGRFVHEICPKFNDASLRNTLPLSRQSQVKSTRSADLSPRNEGQHYVRSLAAKKSALRGSTTPFLLYGTANIGQGILQSLHKKLRSYAGNRLVDRSVACPDNIHGVRRVERPLV